MTQPVQEIIADHLAELLLEQHDGLQTLYVDTSPGTRHVIVDGTVDLDRIAESLARELQLV